MTDSEIGKVIREERQKRGWSQQELAKKVGVTWEMISRYERGKSSALQKILELSDALELEVGRFFGSTTRRPGHFTDASAEYLTSSFIPVIATVPANLAELVRLLSGTETGIRLLDDGSHVEKFGIRLGPDSKIRIASSVLLPKGILVCTLSLGDLSEQSLIVVARNGLVSIEQYMENPKDTILARVVEWVVKL